MDKYSSLSKTIFSIFDSALWKLENIKTFPDNFTQTGGLTEFIRVSIIPSGGSRESTFKSASGVLQIDIFIVSGNGPTQAFYIADRLDKYLVSTTTAIAQKGNIQLLQSSLAPLGIDSANAGLYRYKYTIPFTFFEV